ncbi:hypothetical protein SAMN04487939_11082 [Lysobacter sp. yr284]|uniref:hypothetical protein n=1 Tax=Lysobacter sp. yr284 TaxID=1761791 RepID=UPI00089AC165|nr:hypothetical protein [Lysobacter sp. yr284]SDY96534.1 hypothetical protein SAMN04487939_11082 [Lysobacter sp. yr284]
MKITAASVAIFFTMLTASAWATEPGVNERFTPGATDEEIKSTVSSALSHALSKRNDFAFSPDEAKTAAGRIKAIFDATKTLPGDAGTTYDVVLQIGHFPRKTGKTGGTGKYVTEQQAAAAIADGVRQKLSTLKVDNKAISTIVVGADDFTRGLKTKIFLALHTDSSEKPCSVGPSLGYEAGTSRVGTNGLALATALTLGYDATKFMKDNYTRNLSGYYAYRSINSSAFKALLEMSELSCPEQETNLLKNAAQLSENLAIAIQFSLRDQSL